MSERVRVTLTFTSSLDALREALGGDWRAESAEGITVESCAAALALSHDPADGYIWWSTAVLGSVPGVSE